MYIFIQQSILYYIQLNFAQCTHEWCKKLLLQQSRHTYKNKHEINKNHQLKFNVSDHTTIPLQQEEAVEQKQNEMRY